MKTGIYQIRNLINGNCYIGSCARQQGFKHRWSVHRRRLERGNHHSQHLQNAWNQYGQDAFVFEIMLYCDAENCLTYEQAALDYFKPVYNVCLVANNRIGLKHSSATKAKIATALRGRKLSSSHVANIRSARMGTKASAETRRKMSAAQKRRWRNHGR